MASDGYPVLCPTLAESERIRKRLQEQDPFCFRENKSTKGIQKGNISFDTERIAVLWFDAVEGRSRER